MEHKESIYMAQALQDVQAVLVGPELGSHVGLTDMQRNQKQWRELYDQTKILEILERNDTFGYLLKPEVMRAVRTYIQQLEEQLEQLQVDAMFARREGKMKWATGEDLKQKAMESFHARKDLIRGLLDGNK